MILSDGKEITFRIKINAVNILNDLKRNSESDDIHSSQTNR